MPLYREVVAGELCRVFALPPARPDLIARFKKFMAADSVHGYDVETTAIDEMQGVHEPNARLRMVQFGTRRTAWCLDPHDPMWRAGIKHYLNDDAHRFVSHTNYDSLWARREFGVNLGERSLDTQIMARLSWPAARKTGLKELCDRLIDRGLSDAETAMLARFKELAPPGHRVGKKLKAWGFTNVPLDDELYGRYGGLDAIYVRQLLDILAARLKDEGMAKLSRREQQAGAWCSDISWRGHRVDEPYTRGLLDEVGGEYDAARERLEATFGFSALSPKRGNWLRARGMDAADVIETPTGDVCLDKNAVPIYAAEYAEHPVLAPVFADTLRMSERKNLRTVLQNIIGGMDADGFVHPKVWCATAITGRMSIVRPALQTFKKSDPRHRGTLIARDAHSLVRADYDSQEVRIAAAYSGDPNLRKIVFDGVSMHDLTSEAIHGPDFTEAQRDKIKNLNFAILYGAGPKTIAAMLGISRQEAYEMWCIWRATYAQFVRWSERMATASEIVNMWGRVIPRDPLRPYATGNYAIQSTGRDLLGDALVRLNDADRIDWLWLPIHDEIVLEVPHGREEEACAVLENSMRATIKDVPFTATATVLGNRWSGKDTA